MILILINGICNLLAILLVMIFHELVKNIVYMIYMSVNGYSYKFTDYLKIHKSIDPIGVVLAMIKTGIFSKQNTYIIRSRKAAITIGASGIFSMLFLSAISACSYHVLYVENPQNIILFIELLFFKYLLLNSLMMFLCNLFPIVTFDISLIIAGMFPETFGKIRKHESIFKLLFMIFIILQIFSGGSIILGTYLIFL